MNDRISRHFDEIEARLIECPVILTYQITRRDISPDDGKLRIKSTLAGNGVFECFLYVKDKGDHIQPLINRLLFWRNSLIEMSEFQVIKNTSQSLVRCLWEYDNSGSISMIVGLEVFNLKKMEANHVSILRNHKRR